MTETISQNPDPEQAVFGNAFSFRYGMAGEDSISTFFEERLATIKDGAKTWLPRTLDADSGVCADLYKNSQLLATLYVDYDDLSTSVYITSEDGDFGDTTLCDRVTFAEAVATADQYAGQ